MKARITAWLREWQRKRTWNLERQVAHLITMVRTDNRWMAHSPVVSELTQRYLLALSDTWEQHSFEDVSALRDRLGLSPHTMPVTAPLHDDAYIRGVALGFPKDDSRREILLAIADRVQHRNETYQKPEDGWTCFHCGDRFTTPGAARDHFGASIAATPACQIKAGAERGLVRALRKAEEELAKYREEDQPIVREMWLLQSRHSDALRDAEELGYSRGLKDYATLEEDYKICKHSLENLKHDLIFKNAKIKDSTAALCMIVHATAPTHEDGAYHENAYSLATEALSSLCTLTTQGVKKDEEP